MFELKNKLTQTLRFFFLMKIYPFGLYFFLKKIMQYINKIQKINK